MGKQNMHYRNGGWQVAVPRAAVVFMLPLLTGMIILCTDEDNSLTAYSIELQSACGIRSQSVRNRSQHRSRRRGYAQYYTAVGEAGVERGLAIGSAPCCGYFHAATAHRYDYSVHTERQ